MDRRDFIIAPIAVLLGLAALGPAMVAAQSYRGVTVVELLTNPAAHADEDVMVEGVVRAVQWSVMMIPGPPPRQDLVPMLLVSEGNMALWVVIIGAPMGAQRSTPPVGAGVRIHGTFRAATRAIETDRGITLR